MNLQSYIEKLKENWIPKIICVGAALLIYFFYQVISLDKKSFVIPLTSQDNGLMTSADSIPTAVRVSVRGRAQDIALISERDFSAFIDFSKYTEEGINSIPIQLTVADSFLGIDPLEIRVSPDTIRVNMESRIQEYVSIKPILYGEPRYGFSYSEVRVEPSMVRILGPRSIVNAVSEVTTKGVNLADKYASFSETVELQNDTALIYIDSEEPIEVFVQIETKKATKIFNISPIFENLDNNFVIDDTSRAITIEVSASGNQLVLDALIAQNFSAVVDCTQIQDAGSYALPVALTFPENVSIEPTTLSEITVTVADAQDQP
jgi:YbbR domain-containing protein